MPSAPIVKDIQKTLQQLETSFYQLQNFGIILEMVDQEPQNKAREHLGFAQAFLTAAIGDVGKAISCLSPKN